MKSVNKSRSPDVLRSPRIAPEFSDPELKPGAPDALAHGCTCDPFQNRFGAGQHEDGSAVYFPDQDCPLHGLEAIIKAGA
jgi:hypothetical protein